MKKIRRFRIREKHVMNSLIDSFYRPFFENLNLDFSYGPDCDIEEEEKFGETSDANDNNYSDHGTLLRGIDNKTVLTHLT